MVSVFLAYAPLTLSILTIFRPGTPINPDRQPLNSDGGERVPGLCSSQHPHHPQVRPAIHPRPLSLLTLIVVSVFLAYASLSIITILRSGPPFNPDPQSLNSDSGERE